MALLAGFACMAVIVLLVTALLQRTAPDWMAQKAHPRPAYIFVNLGYSFLAAAVGGYVTAWAAGRSALSAVLALAVVVLVFGTLSVLQAHGRQPIRYQLALVVISPVGVVAGGLVRLRALGVF
jgi:hypothetical protein